MTMAEMCVPEIELRRLDGRPVQTGCWLCHDDADHCVNGDAFVSCGSSECRGACTYLDGCDCLCHASTGTMKRAERWNKYQLRKKLQHGKRS